MTIYISQGRYTSAAQTRLFDGDNQFADGARTLFTRALSARYGTCDLARKRGEHGPASSSLAIFHAQAHLRPAAERHCDAQHVARIKAIGCWNCRGSRLARHRKRSREPPARGAAVHS